MIEQFKARIAECALILRSKPLNESPEPQHQFVPTAPPSDPLEDPFFQENPRMVTQASQSFSLGFMPFQSSPSSALLEDDDYFGLSEQKLATASSIVDHSDGELEVLMTYLRRKYSKGSVVVANVPADAAAAATKPDSCQHRCHCG